MNTQTEKRILDYGYYCDLVETNEGNLRIDVSDEQIKRLEEELQFDDKPETLNENETFPFFMEEFGNLEFIPDLGNDMRFGTLTSSCAIYHSQSNRLWWYPDYQIHNIFQKLIENKEVTFTLAF